MNDHTGRRFADAAACIVALLVLTALTRCAPSEPLPVPPIPPRVVVTPSEPAGPLRSQYDAADARLKVYKALPPCAPSGPILCFDAGKEQGAALAGRDADRALRGPLRGKAGLRAKRRLAAFRRAAHRLPMP